MKKKITIQDVANDCKVSKSSVSRFLNNGYVSEENKKKIQASIQKLGFQRNFFAQRMKANRSYLVGLVINDLNQEGFSVQLQGLQQKLKKQNYHILFHFLDEENETYTHAIQSLSEKGCDCIVIYDCKDSVPLQSYILDNGYHVVFVNHLCLFAPSISLPYEQKIKKLLDYTNHKKLSNVVYLYQNQQMLLPIQQALNNVFDKVTCIFVNKDNEFPFDEIFTSQPIMILCETSILSVTMMTYAKMLQILVPMHIQVLSMEEHDILSSIDPCVSSLTIDYFTFGENVAELILSVLLQRAPKWKQIEICFKNRGTTNF